MKSKLTCLFVFLLLLVGCASIPPEAPELSTELGKRISAIEEANITLLNRFFDQKRQDVDTFIQEEWVPEFAEQFFSNQTIANAWQTIVRENDKEQRLQFLIRTGPRLQQRINQKRQELIQPLEALERAVEKQVRAEYAQARAINNSITSFLASASKVSENRNRYLAMLGVTDEKIGNIINETDDAVSTLLGKAEEVQDNVERADEFLDKVRKIRESI